jgi:hypothetical protein
MRLAANLIISMQSSTHIKGIMPMASELLKLAAEIVSSHASMTELTPKALILEIKAVYGVLAALDDEVVAPAAKAPVARSPKVRPVKTVKMVESPEAKAIQNEEGLAVNEPDYLEFMGSREG